MYPFPTKPTAPGQLLVFILVVAFILLLVGGYLIYLSFGQPPEKLELAMRARSLGIKIVVASLVMGGLSLAGQRWLA